MSYAMLGLGGELAIDVASSLSVNVAAAQATAQQAMAAAADQAMAAARAVGVPDHAFVALDAIVQGRQVKEVLAGQALVFARTAGANALSTATGISASEIDGMLQSVTSGNVSGTIEKAGSIAGAAVGLAMCGPLCGAVGGAIGTIIGTAIGGIVDGIGGLFGASARETAAAEARQMRADAIAKWFAYYGHKESTVAQTVAFGVAQVCNTMLLAPMKQGVDYASYANGWNTDEQLANDVISKAPYFADIGAYMDQHDGFIPDDIEIYMAHVNFVVEVKTRVDRLAPGLWDRAKRESGYDNSEALLLLNTLNKYGGSGPYPPDNGKAPFFPPTALYPQGPPFTCGRGEWGGATEEGEDAISMSPAQLYLPWWSCSLRKHLERVTGILQIGGKRWAQIAARDCAIIRLHAEQLANAKAASTTAIAASQAAAAKAAQQGASVQAQKAAAVAAAQKAVDATTQQQMQKLVQTQIAVRSQAALRSGGLSPTVQAVAIGVIGLGVAAVLYLRD